MTERTNTPPNQSPSEQDIREFERKFKEFFEDLPDREKLQAASLRVLAAKEDGDDEAQQVGEGQEMDPLSEEEIEAFVAKLNGFHDSLPEGQHQILDSMTAKAFVHSVPGDERDDVEGHHGTFQWARWIAPGSQFEADRQYYANYCWNYNRGHTHWINSMATTWGTYWQIGCYR
jgi:hypothetical protein